MRFIWSKYERHIRYDFHIQENMRKNMTKNMRFQKNMTKNIIIFSALLRLRDMMLVHFPHIELHIDPHISEIWRKIWDINMTRICHIFVIFGPDETHLNLYL